MKRSVEIFEYEFRDGQHLCTKMPGHTKQISESDVDSAREAAKKIAADMDLQVKSMSFLTNGNIKIVVHKAKDRPTHVIGGRVYRRPANYGKHK